MAPFVRRPAMAPFVRRPAIDLLVVLLAELEDAMATTREGIGAPATADTNETELVPGGSARREADTGAGSLLFIGTATTLIRYGGFTILTDPTFLHKGETVGI